MTDSKENDHVHKLFSTNTRIHDPSKYIPPDALLQLELENELGEKEGCS